MAILASAIITSLRSILLDPSPGVTWTDARLLALLNEGERAIVLVKHEAYPVRAAIALVAGTKQTITAGGVGLIEVYANTVSKRRVTLVNRELQDAAEMYWPAATPEADVQHYTFDPRDPTRFDVVPPNDATGSVDALIGMTPTAIASTASAINLLDIYEQPLKAFVLSQAYAENTERRDLVKADYYDKTWKALVGMKSASQVATPPQQGKQGGS